MAAKHEIFLSKANTIETGSADRTAHLLKLAAKATARALHDQLAIHSVAYGHWTFLRILWNADGLSITELSLRASVAKPATVSAMHTMEKLKYVKRGQKDGNQKNIYIYLTKTGKELEQILVPLAIEVNDTAVKGLSKSKQESFKKMLLTVIENLKPTA